MPHNYEIFDQNVVSMLNDGDYASSSQRLNGFSGVAQETLANKCLYQLSVMCKAVAQVLSDAGETISDATFSALVISIKNVFQTRFFESTPQTITLAGPLVLPHGMGVAPKSCQLYLQNVTAEFGYSTGDIVLLTGGDSNNSGFILSVKLDSTNITIRLPVNGIAIGNATDGTSTSITVASWNLIIRARG